jgi:hypothetical protein
MVQTTNSPTDLTRAFAGTGDWLDLRSPTGPGPGDDMPDGPRFTSDIDGRLLRDLRGLFAARAPEAELIKGVKRARAGGWSWTPIAIVLESSRDEVIRRFSRGIGHPSARRRRAAAPATG